MSNMELFDFPAIDEFKTALEKYGAWPQTVWPITSGKITKRIKGLIGDFADHRGNLNKTQGHGANTCYGTAGENHVSIFNPQVCSNILNMFAPLKGIVLDPFAGGGTRALLVNAFGLDYEGVELRREEVDAIISRCEGAGVVGGIKIIHSDSRYLNDHFKDNHADFLITCPPYWNLEKYGGGSGDLSMATTYQEFLNGIGDVIDQTYRILKPDSLACWVVGLLRDSNGGLVPLHHDIARLHLDIGFKIKEEIILSNQNNGALQRVGQFEKGNKHLVRTHEYCLIFKKEKS